MMFRTARLAGLALALAAASLAARPALAQETAPTARNAVYVELFGSGLLYSINYDRLLTPNVAGRVGLMFASAEDDEGDSGTVAIVPITASYLFGRGNSHFEAGLGFAVASADFDTEELIDVDESGSSTGVYGTGVLGYRYQRPDGGFVFRAGLTPIITTDSFLPWFGVSFGYGF
jgi:hypothetical protein